VCVRRLSCGALLVSVSHRLVPPSSTQVAGEPAVMALFRTIYEFAHARSGEWGMRLDPFEEQEESIQVVSYDKGGWYGEHKVSRNERESGWNALAFKQSHMTL
jgi:hypothetical protein